MAIGSGRQVAIYGASGYGYSIAHALATHAGVCQVVGFIDDFAGGRNADLAGLPIFTLEEWLAHHAEASILVGVGDPRARARLCGRVAEAGGRFDTLYDGLGATIFPDVTIGRGSYVDTRLSIAQLTRIADHVQIMPMTSIGHDVVIGDCCTICPGSVISGHVRIEPEVFVGAGSTIVNGSARKPLVVGRGAKIFAGSVVTGDVPPGARVSGNPARSLREQVRTRCAQQA